MITETRKPITTSKGEQYVDYEYIREGVCDIWMFTEPLGGWRDVRVSERRTAIDWAQQIKTLVDDPCYAQADRITLVCDNLNTHTLASLYKAFAPAEALRIANRIELVHTPKHGSWLNIAECELSVLSRQCLNRRIPQMSTIATETQAWTTTRNAGQHSVNWQFKPDDARIKLKRLGENGEVVFRIADHQSCAFARPVDSFGECDPERNLNMRPICAAYLLLGFHFIDPVPQRQRRRAGYGLCQTVTSTKHS